MHSILHSEEEGERAGILIIRRGDRISYINPIMLWLLPITHKAIKQYISQTLYREQMHQILIWKSAAQPYYYICLKYWYKAGGYIGQSCSISETRT